MQLLPHTERALSKTDSLNRTIHYLEQRIDSLAKHTQVNEIGQNFFSDAISRDLYMFSTIVVIAGLVSWSFVAGLLAYHKRQLIKSLKKSEAETRKNLDERLESIENNLDNTIHDVNRAMYAKVLRDQDWPNAFAWAMSCTDSFVRLENEDFDGMTIWLIMSEEALDKVPIGNEILIENIQNFTNSLQAMSELGNDGLKETSLRVLKKLNHLVYTIPPVPEDLFETSTPVEPEAVEFEEVIEEKPQENKVTPD